jgi:hypothetical protein
LLDGLVGQLLQLVFQGCHSLFHPFNPGLKLSLPNQSFRIPIIIEQPPPQNFEVESESDYDYGDVPFIVGFPSGHHHHGHHPDDHPGSPSPPLRGPFTPNPAGVPGSPTHLPFGASHLPFGSSRAR